MNKLVLIISLILVISCRSDIEDYSYDKGKLCLRYKLSKNKDTRTFIFENLTSIECRIKANVKYVRLASTLDKPYCSLEACPEILDRIETSVNPYGRLVLDYSKCIQDHRLPSVDVIIAGHNLEEVLFLGDYFYSTDTIISKSGALTLKLKYRGAGFNIVCNVPTIRIENTLFGERFLISGLCDSVNAELQSSHSKSGFDLRNLRYRSLNCIIRNSHEDAYYTAVSYAGEPEYIYYDLYRFGCVPLLYRGAPQLIYASKEDSCETVRPE